MLLVLRLLSILILTSLCLPETLSAANETSPTSSEHAISLAAGFLADGDVDSALRLLEQANSQFPGNANLLSALGQAQLEDQRYGLAEIRFNEALKLRDSESDRSQLTEIYRQYDKMTKSDRASLIYMGRERESGNLATALAIGALSIQKFPQKEILLVEYGRALMVSGQLKEAEKHLREALRLDPLNIEARKIIEEIRATAEAQTSTEVAEWILIAKDKVGDFIVTFLALFTAFVISSAMEPVLLRLKLKRARKAFQEDNYDDFTDLMEGLLDQENFTPLRANLRYLLEARTFNESQAILNKYVNTLERLPTLLRILERENEKLLESK